MDVVAGAAAAAEQTQRVDAYWDMCSSVADYYLGLREQDELRKLRIYVQRVGPTWQQAEAELKCALARLNGRRMPRNYALQV